MANPIKISSTVQQVEKYDEGVYKIILTPSKRLPRFKSGQFLHLTIDDYDPQGGWWPESRVFSIASHSGDEEVTVVYSVKGKYTAKMQEQLKPGKNVWLKLPYGDFTVQSVLCENQDVILIAGGTGISPYIPFIKKEMESFTTSKVRLVYGIRKPQHLLFKPILENALRNAPEFSMDLFIEQAGCVDLINGANHREGIISLDYIYKISEIFKNPVYFLSGPPKMIRTFKNGLVEKGIKSDCIKIDEWE